MTAYIVEIQASNADGTIWQAMAPAKNVEASDGETAAEVANFVAGNQNIADGGNWRICVWNGADADKGTEPAYILDAPEATDPTTTIAALAHELADKFNDSYDEALTAVTTYAAQLDIPNIFEGGQSPQTEIDPETADHIYRAYEASSELA